ncbi:hypothetical protein [Nocardioides sp.]|uniref:hypothetical protein n=1 Tax=Nocardioides sp. TaxID=35761 RepID=UPI0035126A93
MTPEPRPRPGASAVEALGLLAPLLGLAGRALRRAATGRLGRAEREAWQRLLEVVAAFREGLASGAEAPTAGHSSGTSDTVPEDDGDAAGHADPVDPVDPVDPASVMALMAALDALAVAMVATGRPDRAEAAETAARVRDALRTRLIGSTS